MSKTWVYSDPHFYHKNIVKFTDYEGKRLRPWDDAETMTEEMISWYNECVNDQDRVYILGDVAFTAACIRKSVSRMKGRKVLVPGNHDPTKMKKYFDLFDDVRGYVQKQGFIMSHIPLHEDCLGRWRLNIHGHLHNNTVKDMFAGHRLQSEDKRYYCVCVERTDFRPKLLDEILHERGLK